MKALQSMRTRINRRNANRRGTHSLRRRFLPNTESLEARQMLAADLLFDSQFDIDNDTDNGVQSTFRFQSFDFLPGNSLLRNWDGMQQGEVGELLYQASLGNFLFNDNPVQLDGGLNTSYEVTAVMRVDVILGNTDPDLSVPGAPGLTIPGGFSIHLAPTQQNGDELKFFYDQSLNADDLAGTGFDDGVLILSAEIDGLLGNFDVVNAPGQSSALTGLFDQSGADNYAGLQTVRGIGGISAVAEALILDPAYFTTSVGTLMTEDLNLLEISFDTFLPFREVNPSRSFLGLTPNLSPVNGVGEDFQRQADSDVSFSLVPGSIHGFKYDDVDKSGTYDPEVDSPWEGFEFELWEDVDKDGKLDTAIDVFLQDETTDQDGEFWFEELAPGYYLVVEDVNNTPGLPGEIMPSTSIVRDVLICARQEHVWTFGAAKFGEFSGSHIFYNNSAFDGNGSAVVVGTDDNAIDPNKSPYDGTGVAGFANYTSYSRGINGVIVDIQNGGHHKPITASDFEFRSGNDNNPLWWGFAPEPAAVTMSAVNGVNGNTRVYITWDDGAIVDEWLQIKVLANVNTRLPQDEVFYWGNKVGESQNIVGDTLVNGLDVSMGIVPQWAPTGGATINATADFNRDDRVNGLDVSLGIVPGWAPTPGSSLELLNSPPGPIDINQWRRVEVDRGSHLMWGNFAKGSIHGFKFEDFDGDGVYDPPGTVGGPHDGWDLPMGGISFELVGIDGMGQAVGPLVEVSNDEGEFWFEDLPPGRYTVTELPPSWPDTTMPSTETSATLDIQSGEEYVWIAGAAHIPDDSVRFEVLEDADGNGLNESLMFGNFVKGSIHGFKFEDFDGDGKYDPNAGDTPWAGFKFELLDEAGGTLPQHGVAITDANGEFWFEGLRPGYYQVREIDIANDELEPSTPITTGPFFVGSRQELVWKPGAAMLPIGSLRHEKLIGEPLTFGNYVPGSIHGYKCEDLLADGVCNSDPEAGPVDPPMPGVTVFLATFDSNGALVVQDSVLTNDEGEFWFEGLAPGRYAVGEQATPVGVINDPDSADDGNGLPNQGQLIDASGAIAFPNDNVMMSIPGANQFVVDVHSREEYVWQDGAAHLERYCFDSPGLVQVTGDFTHVLCAGDMATHQVKVTVPMADDAYHVEQLEFDSGPQDGGFAVWKGGTFQMTTTQGSGNGLDFTVEIVQGKVRSFDVNDPATGSLDPNKTYNDVAPAPGPGVTGSGFKVNVAVGSDGKITSIAIANPGANYKIGDTFKIDHTQIGGQTFNDDVTLALKTVESMFVDLRTPGDPDDDTSGIDALINDGGKGYMVGDMIRFRPQGSITGDVFSYSFTQGAGYDEGQYDNLPTSSDSPGVGSGLTVNVTVDANNVVTNVDLVTAGSGYKVGDKVRVSGLLLGAGNNDDVILTITSVGNDDAIFKVTEIGNTSLAVELVVDSDDYGQVTSIGPSNPQSVDALTGGMVTFDIKLTGAPANDDLIEFSVEVDDVGFTGDLFVDGTEFTGDGTNTTDFTVAVNNGTLRHEVPTDRSGEDGLIFENFVKGSIHGIKYHDEEALDGDLAGVPFPGIEFSLALPDGSLIVPDYGFETDFNVPPLYSIFKNTGWSIDNTVANMGTKSAKAVVGDAGTAEFSLIVQNQFAAGIGFAVRTGDADDKVEFYIDGVLQTTIQGTNGFDDVWIDGVEWGHHKYTWILVDDDDPDTPPEGIDGGTAWLDDIRFTAMTNVDGEFWIEDIRPGHGILVERLEFAGEFPGEVMPTFENIQQYATSVVGFSTEHNVTDEEMLAADALNAPDGKGWSPFNEDHEHGDPIPEFITVKYDTAVFVDNVVVHELLTGGAVTKILINEVGTTNLHELPLNGNVGQVLAMPLFKSDTVRVEIDTNANWNEFEKIDAIELNGMLPSKTEVPGTVISGEEYVWTDGAAHLNELQGATLREEVNVGDLLEFYNLVKGSIHGLKFEDINGNGIYDNGVDAGWGGFQFDLFTKDIQGDYTIQVGTEVSDGNGHFWFTGLKPGDYRLIEIDKNNPEIENSTATSVDLTVSSGEELVYADGAAMLDPGQAVSVKFETNVGAQLQFGNYVSGSVHGFKFEDVNGDGVYNPADGDTPFGGIPFYIQGIDGWNDDVTGSSVTTNEGEFWFQNLRPGRYRVFERLDQSWDESVMPTNQTPYGTPGSGPYGSETIVTVDSRKELVWLPGAAMLPGSTLKTEVNVGTDLYFGNAVKGSIHGFKCHDVDADGACETNGYVVVIVDASNTMSADFVDLAGDAAVENKLAGAVAAAKSLIASIDVAPTANSSVQIAIVAMGGAGAYTLHGFTTDKAALGTALDGLSAQGDTNLQLALGLSTGLFAGVGAEPNRGNLYVLADGEVNKGDEGAALQDEVDTISTFAGNLVADAIGTDGDLTSLSVIDPAAGHLVDANGVNTYDEGPNFKDPEAPIAGIVFDLSGTDGLGNVVAAQTTTNTDGEFWFENLMPGTYTVSEVLPAGWESSTGTTWTKTIDSREEFAWKSGAAMLPSPTLKVERVDGGLIFGNYVNGSIHGFKFEDVDVNGIYDPAVDRPMSGVQFRLVGPGVDSTRFSQPFSGEFWFTGLRPGHYTLSEVDDPNDAVYPTTPTTVSFDIYSGQEYVWEPGAAGSLTPPVAPPPGIGPNGEPKFEVLADGDDRPENDGQYGHLLTFGNTILGSIHGFKFEDFNGDGIYDPTMIAGETILDDGIDNDGDGFVDNAKRDVHPFRPGLQVQIDEPWAGFSFQIIGDRDGDGAIDSWVATTDTDGEFWATGLFPGTYTIREVLLDPNVVPSTHPSGEYTINVESGEEHVWRDGAAHLPPNDPRFEVNDGLLAFGNSYVGSVHGCVFFDINGNGIHEPGAPGNEPTLNGASLDLYHWDVGSGSLGAFIGSTQSANDPNGGGAGFYWFTGLFPGDYAIVSTTPDTTVTTADPLVFSVGSREELVHRDGAAGLTASDPQHEKNVGAGTLVGIVPDNGGGGGAAIAAAIQPAPSTTSVNGTVVDQLLHVDQGGRRSGARSVRLDLDRVDSAFVGDVDLALMDLADEGDALGLGDDLLNGISEEDAKDLFLA